MTNLLLAPLLLSLPQIQPAAAGEAPSARGIELVHHDRPFPPNVANVEAWLVDWDLDGDLDAIGRSRVSGAYQSEISLLRNDGHGNFELARTLRPYLADLGDTLADLDGDGRIEAFFGFPVVDPSSPTGYSPGLRVVSIEGNGTLDVRWDSAPLPGSFSSPWPADADGDGLTDFYQLFRTSSADRELRVFINQGGATFDPTGVVLAAALTDVETATFADLDGDGALDLVTVGGSVVARFGDGTGGFGPAITLADDPSFNERAVEALDLDDDGDLDLAVHRSSGAPSLYRQDGGVFVNLGLPTGTTLFSGPSTFVDVDGDDLPDLLGGTMLWRNLGDGTFVEDSDRLSETFRTSVADVGRWFGGDLDRDGDVDLWPTQAGHVLLQRDDGRFATTPRSFERLLPARLLGDLTGDGYPDAVGPEFADWQVFVGRVDGSYELLEGGLPEGTTGSIGELRDLDGDGDLDLSFLEDDRRFLNDGAGHLTPMDAPCTAGFVAPAAAIRADFDLDGDLDLFHGIVTYQGGGIDSPPTAFAAQDRLYLRGAGGCLEPAPFPAALTRSLDVEASDLDGDGDLDLLSCSGEIFLNDGAGSFTPGQPLVPAFAPAYLPDASAVGDIDGDGDVDVILGGELSGTELFRNNGDGNFGPGELLPIRAKTLGLADLDEDGDLDLLVGFFSRTGCCLVSGPALLLFENDGSGSFLARELAGIRSTAFTVVDADADGDPDVAVPPYLLRSQASSLRQTSLPAIGRPLSLALRGPRSARYELAAALALDPAPATSPGAPRLRAESIVYVQAGRLDATGRADLEFPVPPLSALEGVRVYWQAKLGAGRWTNVAVSDLSSY